MDEKKIEEKLEEVARKIEEKAHNLGNMVDEKIKEHLNDRAAADKDSKCNRRNHEFWGIILIIFGFLFLAENLHWIHWDVPFIPLAMVVVGFYLLFVR